MKTLVLDIETTGIPDSKADYKMDFMKYPYIVSFSYKIDEMETKQFIINQEGLKIPTETIAIHGITDDIADQSPFTLLKALHALLIDCCDFGKPELVIGHNIYFDTSIIKANVLRLGKQGKCDSENMFKDIEEILHKDRRIDTLRKSIKFCALAGNKWPKLTELYEKCFPGEKFEAHSSKNDVDATYKCYLKLKELAVI